MKKLTALIFCFLLVFVLCACAKEAAEPDEGEGGMPNPCTEYETLAEINEAVGGNLASPPVMGVADIAYIVIDCGDYKIEEYQFNVGGYDYTYRCAVTEDDISGAYLNDGDGTAFENGKCDDIQFNSDSSYKCARCFDGDMQYVLIVEDKGEIEQDTFKSIADEIMQLSTSLSE